LAVIELLSSAECPESVERPRITCRTAFRNRATFYHEDRGPVRFMRMLDGVDGRCNDLMRQARILEDGGIATFLDRLTVATVLKMVT
jgi:hypothetical protein